MNVWRGIALTAALILPTAFLTGCETTAPAETPPAAKAEAGKAGKKDVLVFHFGYQKGSATNLLKTRGDLEKRLAPRGVTVEWSNFPAGPQLLEAVGVGSVDFGSTGESPVIFAQAAGNDLVYVANTPPSGGNTGEGQAIIVPKNSPIKTIADLKGKKIAFQKASSAHNFVVQIVERAGLQYKDIVPIYLAPPDARPAFDTGAIDAWAVWDPFLAAAQKKTDARVLVNSKGIYTAGGFYLSPRTFAERHPDILRIALEEINKTSAWAYDNKEEAAKLLSRDTGIDLDTLLLLSKRATRTGIRPMNEEAIKAQQIVADNFYKIGLLPKKVDVRAAVMTPQQYAAIVPPETGAATATPGTGISRTARKETTK